MDQDKTWCAGRPRPWPHYVRSGPSSPSPKGAEPTNFRPISVVTKWLDGSRCQMVVKVRPKLHCVRWGPSSPPKRGQSPPLNFGPCLLWPNGWMDQDGTWHGAEPQSRPHCRRRGPSSSHQKTAQLHHFLVHVFCGQTAGCIKMPLGVEVGLGRGHIMLDEDPAPLPKRGQSPNFRAISIVAQRLDASRCHLVWR